nr:hypothetical protein [Nannocystis pusilla]
MRLLVEDQRQLLDPLRHRHRLDLDLVGRLHLRAREHAVVGLREVEQRHRREAGVDRRHHQLGAAGEHVASRHRQRVELGRGLLEPLVLDQPADQRLARVLALLLLALARLAGARLRRQQLAALEVRQRRRHHQVVARDLEVELAHDVEVLEVLLGDERDRDVEDVELVLAHEVQQQVERALEHLELDRVDRARRPLPLARAWGALAEARASLLHRPLPLAHALLQRPSRPA